MQRNELRGKLARKSSFSDFHRVSLLFGKSTGVRFGRGRVESIGAFGMERKKSSPALISEIEG